MALPADYDRICMKIKVLAIIEKVDDAERFKEYLGTIYEEVLFEMCISHNSYSLLEYLFANGFDPDKKLTKIMAEPISLLHLTVFYQDYDMLEFLLRYVKDINFRSFNTTPLQWAEDKAIDPTMEKDESIIADMIELLRLWG